MQLVTQKEKLVSEERKGVGPRPGHSLVVYEIVNPGLEFHCVLGEGETFRPRSRKFFGPKPEYASYAVNMHRHLLFRFTDRFGHMSLGHEFDLTFTLSYRVVDARRLVDALSNDPLRKIQEDVTRLLGGKAMAIEWSTIVDSKVKNNFAGLASRIAGGAELMRVQELAGETGIEVLGIDVALDLTTDDVIVVKEVIADEREAELEEINTGKVLRTSASTTKIDLANITFEHEKERLRRKLESGMLQGQHYDEMTKQQHRNNLTALELSSQFQTKAMEASVTALGHVAEEIRSPEQLLRASELVAQALGLFGGTSAPGAQPGLPAGSPRALRMSAGSHGELATELAIAQEKATSISDESDRKLFVSLVMHWFAELQLGRGADKEILDRYRTELESIGIRLRSGLSPELFDYVQRILDGDAMARRFA